jgi:hypothetical protein
MMNGLPFSAVIPAKAGIHKFPGFRVALRLPGMTGLFTDMGKH